jgi:dUTP pyrophosphatase
MSSSPQLKKRKMSASEIAVPFPLVVEPANNLLIKRLSDKARLPTRGSALAAGYDLYRYATLFMLLAHSTRLTRFFVL